MGPRAEGRGSSPRYRRGGRSRRTFAAGGALLSLVVLGLGIGLASPAAGSASGGASTGDRGGAAVRAQAVAASTTIVTTTPTGTATSGLTARTLAVSPYSALAPSGAQVTVSGKGYSEDTDLWVAVCQSNDKVAPAALIHCVGGAIPDDNETTGWGIVTNSATAPYPGAVVAKWDTKNPGSFTLTLVLPAAIGDAVDCVSNPCSVYTRSSDDEDRTEDVAVPVTFTPPPTTPTTTSSSTPTTATTTSSSTPTTSTPTTPTTTEGPTTSTMGGSATTVSPDSMLQTSVAVGGTQVVVFSGFTPGEGVAVTLFSDPISLPSVTADNTGTVRIEFVVPTTLSPGVHLLQAIGAQSNRVGIAQFAVTAATTSASSTPTTSSSPSPTTSSSPTSSSAATSSESSSAEATTSSPSPTPSATLTTAITAPAGNNTSNNLLWLWITLAVVVLVGAAAGIVAMVRARNHDDEDDLPPLVVAGAPDPPPPGWSGATAVVAPPTHGDDAAVGAGDFGLLSGREPELLSGRGGPDATTQLIGPAGPEAPTQYIGPSTGTTGPAGGAAAPATGPADPGPSTQGWQPDFTSQQPTVDPPTAVRPPDETEPPSSGGRHHRGD